MTFQTFDKYLDSKIINEGFIVKNKIVFFDTTSNLFIDTKFGKNKKLAPYVTGGGSVEPAVIHSFYKINKLTDSTYTSGDILRALKGQHSLLTIDYDSYDKWLQRSALYLVKLIKYEKIDIIMTIDSSSSLNIDFVNKLKKYLPPYFEFITYTKSILKVPELTTLDLENIPHIDDKTKAYMMNQLEKQKKEGKITIKKLVPRPQFRKYIKGLFQVKGKVIEKLIDSNILLIDDILSSGSSLKMATESLNDAGANKVLSFTLIKNQNS